MSGCEICGSRLLRTETGWARPGRECERCGEFRFDAISGGLRAEQPWFSENEIQATVRVSGWVREQNAAGNVPTLTNEDVKRVIARPRPNLKTRAMLLLRQIAQLNDAMLGGHLATQQIVRNKKLWGISYSLEAEVHVLLRLLDFEKLIALRINPEGLVLTIEGILAVEEMEASGGEFSQGFVAMWFNPEFDAAWTHGFDPAIREAGYRPFRIDKKEYVGGITDEITTTYCLRSVGRDAYL